jgi:hypothetical protein
MLADPIACCMPLILCAQQILLIGGDKTGHERWYEIYVPIADRLYDEHVQQLRHEEEVPDG